MTYSLDATDGIVGHREKGHRTGFDGPHGWMSAEEPGRQDVAGLVKPQAGQAAPEPRERGAHAAGLLSIGVILRRRGTRPQDHDAERAARGRRPTARARDDGRPNPAR